MVLRCLFFGYPIEPLAVGRQSILAALFDGENPVIVVPLTVWLSGVCAGISLVTGLLAYLFSKMPEVDGDGDRQRER
jgi:hypothetical protein